MTSSLIRLFKALQFEATLPHLTLGFIRFVFVDLVYDSKFRCGIILKCSSVVTLATHVITVHCDSDQRKKLRKQGILLKVWLTYGCASNPQTRPPDLPPPTKSTFYHQAL